MSGRTACWSTNGLGEPPGTKADRRLAEGVVALQSVGDRDRGARHLAEGLGDLHQAVAGQRRPEVSDRLVEHCPEYGLGMRNQEIWALRSVTSPAGGPRSERS